jgi:hypothetical protein
LDRFSASSAVLAERLSRDSGGTTARRYGEWDIDVEWEIVGRREDEAEAADRVGDAVWRFGDEVGEGEKGSEGMTIPNDWAIRPSCLGDRGCFGGGYRRLVCSSSPWYISSLFGSWSTWSCCIRTSGIARSLPLPLWPLSQLVVRVRSLSNEVWNEDGVESGERWAGLGRDGQASSGEEMAGAVDPPKGRDMAAGSASD